MTALTASYVYRDYEVDGVPASGPHKPIKSEIRTLFAGVPATPDDYKLVSDPDDTNCVNAFLADLAVQSGLLGRARGALTRKYITSATCALLAWSGTIEIDGNGGSIAMAAASANQVGLQLGNWVTTPTTYVTANAVRGASALTLTSTAGLSAGQYIVIYAGTGVGTTYLYAMTNRIKAVSSGTVITLERPIPFALLTANPIPTAFRFGASTAPFVSVATMVAGKLVLSDVEVTGTGTAGANAMGLFLANLVGADVNRTRTSGFSATNGVGTQFNTLYDGVLRDVKDDRSGSPAGGFTSAIATYSLTGCILEDVVSEDSPGFGILNDWLMCCQVSRMKGNNSAGRGVKFYACVGNHLDDLDANNNVDTGVDLDGTSCYNYGSRVRVAGNAGGFHFLGTGSHDNFFDGVDSINNGTFGIANFSSVALDTNIKLVGVNSDALVVVQAASAMTVEPIVDTYVSAIPSTNQAIANNTETQVAFATEVADTNGEYVPGTGIFTSKFAKFLRVDVVVEFTAVLTGLTTLTVVLGDISVNVTGAGQTISFSRAAWIRPGTTVEAFVTQTSGSGATILSGVSSTTSLTISP